VFNQPVLGAFFGLSVVPALLIAAYIRNTDITSQEPLTTLVATFMLAILFAAFAALLNSSAGSIQAIPVIGSVLFFYLVVGPVEEIVKLLAVRVFAFRTESFGAVVDGAVYGAVAGLGFATIENTIYITRTVTQTSPEAGLLSAATGITTLRALAGPGHVIWSSIAGYYLGLAKFNPEYSGPLVVKGLVIAAFVHGTYNVTVGWVPGLVAALYPIGPNGAIISYIIFFNLVVGYGLYRKISRYKQTYRTVRPESDGEGVEAERTEFDPDG
jgi:RsiW-degrading membrane proteinase PrsW (M82 family)